MSKRRTVNTSVLVLAVIGSLVLINFVAARLPCRLDLTKNGEFTLNQATIDVLKNLKDPVTVRAYFTEDLPPQLASVSRYVKDILDEYYAHGGGNFRYEFIDPTSEETEADKQKKKEVRRDIFGQMIREQTSVEQELESYGIRPVQLRVNEAAKDKIEEKRVYMGLVVTMGLKREAVPFLQGTDDFEYDLTTMIRKVSRPKEPKIALIEGHNNPDLNKEMRTAYEALQKLYDVTTVDLGQGGKIADDANAILVVGPQTAFSEDEMRAIDKFVTSGKSAAFLLGPVAPKMETLEANPIEHGLTDLLGSYGVKIESGLVLDTQCATIGVTQQHGNMRIQQPVAYPFVLLPKALTADHPLTRGLGEVALPFMGPLTLAKDLNPGVKGEVLVRSSKNSWVQPSPYNLDPFQFQKLTRDMVGELAPKDLVVTLAGAIPSYFAPKTNTAEKTNDADKASEGGKGDEAAKAGAEDQPNANNARVLVANGHGFILDQFMSKGNQTLVQNLMDWLVMDEALLAMRSRGLTAAPLDELSDGTRGLVKYLNIIGLPIAFVGFGLVRWRMREAQRKTIKL